MIVKGGLFGGRGTSRWERGKKRMGEDEFYRSTFYIYMYENHIIKPTKNC
jgi:hypothetical protein